MGAGGSGATGSAIGSGLAHIWAAASCGRRRQLEAASSAAAARPTDGTRVDNLAEAESSAAGARPAKGAQADDCAEDPAAPEDVPGEAQLKELAEPDLEVHHQDPPAPEDVPGEAQLKELAEPDLEVHHQDQDPPAPEDVPGEAQLKELAEPDLEVHRQDQDLPTEPPPRQWAPGSLVERLLDDVSDIWVGAVVLAAHQGDIYDVEYPDDGSVERAVEGHELRRRNYRMDLPSEVWVYVAHCFYEKLDICAFEALARMPQAAAQRESKLLWCTAYHERFSRCGPRCTFVRGSGAVASAKAIAGCVEAADLGLTPVDRMPWKARFAEQERFNTPSWREEAPADAVTPGDAAYGVSGKKVRHSHLDGRLRYGANALSGWYYDPRLGRMVREC
uniref:Uncharacterized protein n=1 Tax=Alexandrium monilatum TaxID=311494 RepID=A0A7S4QB95_9DINO